MWLILDLDAYVKSTVFDTEINAMKDLIAALGAKGGEKVIVPSGPTISASDLNEFRDAAKKVKELEKRVVDLEKNKADKSDLDEIRSA